MSYDTKHPDGFIRGYAINGNGNLYKPFGVTTIPGNHIVRRFATGDTFQLSVDQSQRSMKFTVKGVDKDGWGYKSIKIGKYRMGMSWEGHNQIQLIDFEIKSK